MENKAPQANPQTDMPEEFMKSAMANKRGILWATIIILVLAIAATVYIFISQSGSRKADEKIALADTEQNDSIAMTLYEDAAKAGYKSGNRAKAELAIRLFRQGDYEGALKYLNDANIKDHIVAAGVESLKGDCYVNLGELDKALKAFDAAIKAADKNPQLVPMLLIKKANVLREKGDYAAEAQAYKTIIEDYPRYVQGSQTDIRKFYERAAAQAAAKK